MEHFFPFYTALFKALGRLGEFPKVTQTRDVVTGMHSCLECSQP